jgi:tRNA G18 (ribose-2'-O)-methylase SpoU
MKDLVLVLPDIRSGYNVGSLFRTSDGLGVSKIVLAGFTPYPPHPQISKTALDAEFATPWQYYLKPLTALQSLKNEGYLLIALEKTKDAVELGKFEASSNKLALICGNEIAGVSAEILALADHTLAIEMQGTKDSYNVAVAASIALYALRGF